MQPTQVARHTDVADAWHVSPKTVRRWIDSGAVDVVQLPSGRVKIAASALPRAAVATIPETAARYGVSPKTVRRWIAAGTVAAVRSPGGAWRVYVDSDAA
jgi:excisionase family DNA binding protein